MGTPAAGNRETVSNNPLSIAIVDDEESVCRALQRLLRAAGYGVETFTNGAVFLDTVAARRPDCLVLDLHMPRTSGFDVLGRLRDAGERVPVVVITGHDTPQNRERVMEAGAAAYLRKPADEQTLLDAVSAAIEGAKGPP